MTKLITICFLLTPWLSLYSMTEQMAADIANEWLALIDQGSFEEAWKESSQDFKEGNNYEKVYSEISKTRKSLGALDNRNIIKVICIEDKSKKTSSVYWGIKYESTYAVAGKITEKIILSIDEKEHWKVAGYYFE